MKPSPSYEKVNYSLRPAKNIERKMIVEVCSRLRGFYSMEAYRYIGFGSPFFSDFSLIHRYLGIKDMVCIEQNNEDRPRFEFNKPFDCISLEFGQSHDILPVLEWVDRPSIIWLDYDGRLNENIFSDIDVVVSKVVTGSIFIITLRAEASDFGQQPQERIDAFRVDIGEKLPMNTSNNEFSVAYYPKLIHRLIDAEINHIISERNAGLGNGNKFEYSQLFHFNYSDSTKMTTIGGLVSQIGQRSKIAQCEFESCFFVRTGDEPYKIIVPKLTIKEIRALNEQLPNSSPSLPRVSIEDINAYSSNYRYFPTFVESEL